MSRKTWVLLVGVCVFLAAGSRTAFSGAPDSTKPNAGQITAEKADVGTAAGPAKTNAGEITFELKYRGLSEAKGEIGIGATYAFHSPVDAAPSTFTKNLNLPSGKGLYFSLPRLQTQSGEGEWLALEIDGDKSAALYMDLDGDCKFSPSERILPSKELLPAPLGPLYVTPDFKGKTPKGKESPYRVFLMDRTNGVSQGKMRHYLVLRPACLWEGVGSIAGKSFHLILFDGNFDGLFTEFGEDSYALMPEADYLKTQGKSTPLPREPLSGLVPIEQQFYSLRLESTPDGLQPAKAILKRSEIPLGKIVFEFKGTEGVKAELSSAYLTQGGKVFFNLTGIEAKERELPVGSYQVENGFIRYGSVKPDEWGVNFQNGSEITVAAGTPCIVRLGQPKLTPTVTKEQDRYSPEAKPETAFKKGDEIYCSPEIKGMAGEQYGRFYGSSTNKAPEPQVRIQDANGKEVVSASMQYG